MPRLLSPRGLAAMFLAYAALAVMSLGLLPQPSFAQGTLEADDPAIEFGGEPGEMKAIAIVGLAGYDSVMDDVGYLGGLAGRPEGAQMIEGMIALFTQGKGLQGIDKSRPWGVVVQSDGMQFVPVICLPIDDLDTVLSLVEGFGVMSDDAGGGVTELTVPNSPMPLFAKQVGEWVYVSQTAESLDTAPADPTALLADLVDDYDLGARVLAQNVPAMYKQMALDGLRQGLEDSMEQEPDESDEQFAARQKITQMQVDQIMAMVEDTDEMTLGVAVNESGQAGLAIDFTWTGIAGSDLLDQFAMYQAAPSNFAGFAQPDASMSLLQSTETPPENLEGVIAQTMPQLDTVKAQIEQFIDDSDDLPNEEAREVLKSVLADVWESVEATIKTGKTDTGMSVSMEVGELKAMVGGAMAKPEKIESALRKLEALAADDPDFPGVQWEAATHAGIKFHTMTIPIPDLEVAEVLGDSIEIAVGIGDGQMCVAAGVNPVQDLIKAIDDSASQTGKEVPPFEMTFSLKQIMEFIGDIAPPGEKAAQMMGDMFADLGDEESRIVMTVSPMENGIRYRMTAAEGVLQAIGQLANMAAQQAGAGGPPF